MIFKRKIYITKASGEREAFSETKFRESLSRSGAEAGVIDAVARKVGDSLYQGISTVDIYRLAFSLLRQHGRPLAARYSLKRALLDLGPSGHPFEKFIGAILRQQGYRVEVAKIIPGFCVQHEVDIVAKKDRQHVMVEAKFHNQLGLKTDVKVALYVQARFEDIRKRCEREPGHGEEIHAAWLVTNTKFTSDAIQYGRCARLNLLGWDYPERGSLQQIIESNGLQPLTCLTTLSSGLKRELIGRGVVLCRDIRAQNDIFARNRRAEALRASVLREVDQILSGSTAPAG